MWDTWRAPAEPQEQDEALSRKKGRGAKSVAAAELVERLPGMPEALESISSSAHTRHVGAHLQSQH